MTLLPARPWCRYGFGWAVKGFAPNDTHTADALPISLAVFPWKREPDTRSGAKPDSMLGELTVTGLTTGSAYVLLPRLAAATPFGLPSVPPVPQGTRIGRLPALDRVAPPCCHAWSGAHAHAHARAPAPRHLTHPHPALHLPRLLCHAMQVRRLPLGHGCRGLRGLHRRARGILGRADTCTRAHVHTFRALPAPCTTHAA